MNIFKFLLALCLALLASAGPITNNTEESPPMFKEIGRRRGIAYNNPDFVRYFNKTNVQIGWTYNWWRRPNGVDTSTWEYVPMLWGNHPDMTAGWNDGWKHAADDQPGNPTHLLSFNEPDNCEHGAGGSCLSIADAVKAWNEFMQPAKLAKEKMYLGTPAVTNSGAPNMGLNWLKAFMKACTDCSFDFICIHWYDSATNAAYFKRYIEEVRGVAQGRPIWITEFAPSGSEEQIKKFLNEVIPWMDGSQDIHRYAYFMAKEGSLVNYEGTAMSEIGKHFAYWRPKPDGGFTTEP